MKPLINKEAREAIIKVLMEHNELYCQRCLENFLKLEWKLNSVVREMEVYDPTP